MKIKDYTCKCGNDNFFMSGNNNQIGIYCSYCGKWLKWADKNEQNLAMKQEPILDKIKAEIESKIIKKPYLNFKIRERERNDAFLEVLDIIDKYMGESEGKE